MNLHITPQALVNQTIARVEQNENQLATLQEQASSGNRIMEPSDDPVDAVTVMSSNTQSLQLQSYLGNITTRRIP